MRYSILLFAFAFTAGYTAKTAFPTKHDKEIRLFDYDIACFDGQISATEAIFDRKELRDCDNMAKERIK